MQDKNQSIFEDFATDYGGAFPVPKFEKDDQDSPLLSFPLMELNVSSRVFQGKTNGKGIPFNPYVGLLMPGSGKALASFHNGLHISALDMTLLAKLYGHFSSLMSHPKIFEGVGDPSRDSQRIKWNNQNEDSLLLYLGKLDKRETMGGPESRDPIRRQFGSYLFLWALRFIGYHEIGHSAQGHVHLFQENNFSACLFDSAETYRTASYYENARTTQIRALEQQADIHAMERLINALVIDTMIHAKNVEERRKSIILNVSAMMFSVSTVLRMWCKGMENIRISDKLDHPHPAIRYKALIETSVRRLKDLSTDIDDWTNGMGMFFSDASIADVVLGCKTPLIEWDEHGNELKNCYNEINAQFREHELHEKLEEHTFTELPDEMI